MAYVISFLLGALASYLVALYFHREALKQVRASEVERIKEKEVEDLERTIEMVKLIDKDEGIIKQVNGYSGYLSMFNKFNSYQQQLYVIIKKYLEIPGIKEIMDEYGEKTNELFPRIIGFQSMQSPKFTKYVLEYCSAYTNISNKIIGVLEELLISNQ